MNLFQKLGSEGLILAAVVGLSIVPQARAAFTLTGTPAELVARGINADFETPVLTAGETEVFNSDLGAGWTFNVISGVSSNQGLQNPATGYYGQVNPLPAPFESNQVAFFNLDNFSQAEIVSNPIGKLQAGQSYTLNVAVGARNNDGWSDIAYRIGLRASDGTDLGTFATMTLNPSSTIPTNIADLTYTLNASSVPGFVGDDVSVVIGAFNTGMNEGALTQQFTQANVDNVRLAGTFDDLVTPPSASLTINRQTGSLSLSNTGAGPLGFVGYSLRSAAGAFDQANWLSIAENYDRPSAPTPGSGAVDSDDAWTILSAPGSTVDLSEAELSGGDGGILGTTPAVPLGNAWLRTPFEDVEGQLLLADGSAIPLTIGYGGNAIPSGDLNGDGNITTADWSLFKAGAGSSFAGLSRAQAYLKGDLTGDLRHNLSDFVAFRSAFETANGAGSFGAALSAVPEPSTSMLLIVGCLLTLAGTWPRNERRGILSMNRFSRNGVALVIAIVACALAVAPASAQNVVSHWSFDSPTLTLDAGNITAVAEQTGNHNAVVGTDGTGGGTGDAFVSAAFDAASSSVSGQFNEALRFNGDNFLLFPNLTELMESSGGPSYSISMWVHAPPEVEFEGAHPFATLSNWGNEPASTGPTRFVYAYGPGGATVMRGQSRRNEPSSAGGGTNGDDIFARNATTSTINDSQWHMLTWTFNTTSGVLNSYFDGSMVDTFTSTDPSFAMADSSSAVGGIGIKGDNGFFLPQNVALDEIWVFEDVLSDEQIQSLFNANTITPVALTLRVDTASGQVQLRNDSGEDIPFRAYRVSSESGSLNPSGWDPIATGTPVPGFPQGDGTGDGWEVPSAGGPLTGDYNSDGQVDAADYVAWRKGNINGQQGYEDWRANFGATGGGNGGDSPSPHELVEWYLNGDSTLANGGSISLGQAFSVGGDQDLAFQFATSTGVITGTIEYGAIGVGSQAVPEPSSGWLMLAGVVVAVAYVWRRSPRFARVRACAGLTAVLVAGSIVTSTEAAVTLDRLYLLGDNSPNNTENGVDGNVVGSANTISPGTTLDHMGPTGSFQDLAATASGKPSGSEGRYEDVSSRPGATAGSLGVLFDGTDDYLTGFSLGFPPISRGTKNGGGSGTLNYDGIYQRGFQLWVFPHSGATAEQHLVSDTTEHGLRITSGGNWMLRHAGTNVNSNVPVAFNEWSHVMVAIPEVSNPYLGVLYVDGVALAAQRENYSTAATVNEQALIVGANTDADGTMVGTANFFRGVLDDLEMFVWGRAYDPATGDFIDYGTFDFAEDNEFAASFLTGVPGDINNSGAFSQADVDAFVAGWLNEKRINNVRVGDLETFAMGDLNFDGITDLADARLLRSVIGGAGAGGLNLSGFTAATGVPEPSALCLSALAITSLMAMRRTTNR